MKRHHLGSLIALASMTALGWAPTSAQEIDGRWGAFLGCWEPVGETVEQGMLCVRPAEGGVEIITVVEGEITTSDLLVADGAARQRTLEGCEGSESARFSMDGRRVFTRSDFVCGEELPRTATGIMSMTAPTRWLDVRSVDVDGEAVAWVQEYRLVGPERVAEAGIEDPTLGIGMAVRSARMAASRPIRLSDVEEAVAEVDPKAVEAWVAARGERFELNADALMRLDDAGVPASVIDVVVAVSYPERFQIDEPIDGAGMRGTRVADMGDYDRNRDRYGYGGRNCWGSRFGYYGVRSLYWNPFYYGYSSCYSPYYSPYSYGYGFYGYPFGGYYYTPRPIIITERTSSRARVINGRGYSSGRTGNSGAASRGGAGGARVTPAGASAGSGGSRASGGASTGRKAKPRGGRGG